MEKTRDWILVIGVLLILGLGVFLVVPMFWLSLWAFPCSLAAIVALALFGVVVGRAIDTRENIKDLIR